MGYLFYVWLIILILTVIIEIATTDLTSIWFSVGSLAALIVNLFLHNEYIFIQITVFALVSIVSILLLRPLLRKKMDTSKVPTNVDALIGKVVIVVSTIDLNSNGTIKIEGIEWSAKTETERFEPGELVEIVSVTGNTLLVERRKEK